MLRPLVLLLIIVALRLLYVRACQQTPRRMRTHWQCKPKPTLEHATHGHGGLHHHSHKRRGGRHQGNHGKAPLMPAATVLNPC